MAIIIGDIHGDLGKAKAFLAYKPEVDHIVLGDYVDSCSAEITAVQELSCLDLLIDSEAVLLWGNHDLAYLSPSLWKFLPRFEKHWLKYTTFMGQNFAQSMSRKAKKGINGYRNICRTTARMELNVTHCMVITLGSKTKSCGCVVTRASPSSS